MARGPQRTAAGGAAGVPGGQPAPARPGSQSFSVSQPPAPPPQKPPSLQPGAPRAAMPLGGGSVSVAGRAREIQGIDSFGQRAAPQQQPPQPSPQPYRNISGDMATRDEQGRETPLPPSARAPMGLPDGAPAQQQPAQRPVEAVMPPDYGQPQAGKQPQQDVAQPWAGQQNVETQAPPQQAAYSGPPTGYNMEGAIPAAASDLSVVSGRAGQVIREPHRPPKPGYDWVNTPQGWYEIQLNGLNGDNDMTTRALRDWQAQRDGTRQPPPPDGPVLTPPGGPVLTPPGGGSGIPPQPQPGSGTPVGSPPATKTGMFGGPQGRGIQTLPDGSQFVGSGRAPAPDSTAGFAPGDRQLADEWARTHPQPPVSRNVRSVGTPDGIAYGGPRGGPRRVGDDMYMEQQPDGTLRRSDGTIWSADGRTQIGGGQQGDEPAPEPGDGQLGELPPPQPGNLYRPPVDVTMPEYDVRNQERIVDQYARYSAQLANSYFTSRRSLDIAAEAARQAGDSDRAQQLYDSTVALEQQLEAQKAEATQQMQQRLWENTQSQLPGTYQKSSQLLSDLSSRVNSLEYDSLPPQNKAMIEKVVSDIQAWQGQIASMSPEDRALAAGQITMREVELQRDYEEAVFPLMGMAQPASGSTPSVEYPQGPGQPGPGKAPTPTPTPTPPVLPPPTRPPATTTPPGSVTPVPQPAATTKPTGAFSEPDFQRFMAQIEADLAANRLPQDFNQGLADQFTRPEDNALRTIPQDAWRAIFAGMQSAPTTGATIADTISGQKTAAAPAASLANVPWRETLQGYKPESATSLFGGPKYDAPEQGQLESALTRSLSGGMDQAALSKQLSSPQLEQLEFDRQRALQDVNADMARRNIFDSSVKDRAIADVEERFARQKRAVLSDAGAQSVDMARQYAALAGSELGSQRQFGLEKAGKQAESFEQTASRRLQALIAEQSAVAQRSGQALDVEKLKQQAYSETLRDVLQRDLASQGVKTRQAELAEQARQFGLGEQRAYTGAASQLGLGTMGELTQRGQLQTASKTDQFMAEENRRQARLAALAMAAAEGGVGGGGTPPGSPPAGQQPPPGDTTPPPPPAGPTLPVGGGQWNDPKIRPPGNNNGRGDYTDPVWNATSGFWVDRKTGMPYEQAVTRYQSIIQARSVLAGSGFGAEYQNARRIATETLQRLGA